MKNLLIAILMVTAASVAEAADRVKAKATTDLLNTFVTKSQSTTPDKALYYESDRDDVDNHSTTSGLTITIDNVNNKVRIIRTDSRTYTACSADYGTVTIENNLNPSKYIEVSTDRKPIRVSCNTADGKTRGFFTTYKD